MNRFVLSMFALALGGTVFVASSASVWASGSFVPAGSGTIVGGGTGGGNCGLTNTAGSNTSPVTITASAGEVITEVAVHDGNSVDFNQTQCVAFTSDGSFVASNGVTCYTVTGIGTGVATVTYTGTGAGKDCGAISFVAYDQVLHPTTSTTTTTTSSTTGGSTTGATPEMDSIALFGVGVLALSGFGLYQRRRSARRA